MSEMKLMTLSAQQHYDEKIKGFIANEDAKLLDKIETHVHSWNDLEDKPFGEEVTKTVIVEEQTILAGDYKNDWNNVLYKDFGYYNERPTSVIVVFDGNTYEYNNFDEVLTEGVFYEYFGNGRLIVYFANEADEPFALAYSNGRVKLYVSDTNVEHTIEAYTLKSNLKTLDETYIPDTIARISDLENIDLTPYETKTDAAAKLEEAKAFASEEDAKVQAAVEALDGKVTALIAEDTNKSVRTIANEELAKQLVAEGAKESLDTLTEIAAWIQSHPDDASAMNKAINDLEALVGALPDGVSATTIVGYVQEVVAAEREYVDGQIETHAHSWNDLKDKPFGLSEKQYIVKPVTLDNGYITEYLWVPDGTACTVVVNGEVKDAVVLNKWDYVNETDALVFEVDGRYIVSNYSYDFNFPFTGTFEAYIPGEIRTLDSKFIGSDIARVSDFCEVANEEIDAMFA